MNKKVISIFTVFMLVFSTFSWALTTSVQAYQNSAYFNNLKVGLESMAASTLTGVLNGDYSLNGTILPSGTTLNFKITNGNVNINGIEYSTVSLVPQLQGNLFSLSNGSKTNKYLSSFTFKVVSGKILPINSIFIEDYLKGVVSNEMSDYFPMEALKAQAVAARNYALSRVGYCIATKGYDFDDTINYQVYGGYDGVSKNSFSAVDSTRGQLLLYNDKLVETLYSSSDGGYTEASQNVWGNTVPYLIYKADSYDSQSWPNGAVALTNSQISTTLKSKGYLASTDTFIKLDLASITKYPSGRVSNINIIYKNSLGTQLTQSIQMDKTRTFLGLPSSMYNVVYDSVAQTYTFTGKGYGHGLGMSQIGAKNRASAGQTYDQILKFYYDGSYLQNVILKASIQSFTLSKTQLFLGDNLSFNTAAQGGNGQGFLYKYVVSKAGNTIFTADYSANSSLPYTPTAAGQYTVSLFVKDKFSTSDYDAKQDQNFTVYALPNIGSFTSSKTQVITGQNINFAAQGKDGSSSYLYKYVVSKDNAVVYTRDYLSDGTLTFTAPSAGSYNVSVYLKDALSTKDYDSVQNLSFTTYDSPQLASFTQDKTQLLNGQSITFNAVAQNGTSQYLYRYVINKDGSPVYTQDYSVSGTLAYTPAAAGNYEANVYVKDASSDNNFDATQKLTFTTFDAPKISSYTASSNETIAGQSVSLNASTLGGSGSYQYKYAVINNGTPVFTKDYSTDSTLVYTPSAPGNYEIDAYVKDALANTDYNDMQKLNITAYSAPSLSSVSLNKASLLVSQDLQVSAMVQNGSGHGYLYKYVISKDGIDILTKDYDTNSSFTYTPTLSGSYSVTVYVKDIISNSSYDATTALNFNVYASPTLSGSTASGYMYEGRPITLNSNTLGGSPNGLTYKYEVLKNGVLFTTRDFTNSPLYTFTPDTSAAYTVNVYIKDILSSKPFDANKTFNLSVLKAPLTVSALPISYGMRNTDVTTIQNALNKLGFNVGTADGIFGTKTKTGVTNFQTSKGITADGVVNLTTFNALNNALIDQAGTKSLSY